MIYCNTRTHAGTHGRTHASTDTRTHKHFSNLSVCTSFSYLEKIYKVRSEKSAMNVFLSLVSKEEMLSDSGISLLSRLLLSRTDA